MGVRSPGVEWVSDVSAGGPVGVRCGVFVSPRGGESLAVPYSETVATSHSDLVE